MHQVGKKDYYYIRMNGQQNIKILFLCSLFVVNPFSQGKLYRMMTSRSCMYCSCANRQRIDMFYRDLLTEMFYRDLLIDMFYRDLLTDMFYRDLLTDMFYDDLLTDVIP